MFNVGDTGRTRDGRRYTITSTDGEGTYGGVPQPIVARIVDSDGNDDREEYTADGHYFSHDEPADLDLMPPRFDRILAVLIAAGHVTEDQVAEARRLVSA